MFDKRNEIETWQEAYLTKLTKLHNTDQIFTQNEKNKPNIKMATVPKIFVLKYIELVTFGFYLNE